MLSRYSDLVSRYSEMLSRYSDLVKSLYSDLVSRYSEMLSRYSEIIYIYTTSFQGRRTFALKGCLYVYILTKSEFISSCSRPAVGSNITLAQLFFVNSLCIAFPTISDQYHNFYFCDFFYKMAAGGHFGCPKITFGRISGHFRSI